MTEEERRELLRLSKTSYGQSILDSTLPSTIATPTKISTAPKTLAEEWALELDNQASGAESDSPMMDFLGM